MCRFSAAIWTVAATILTVAATVLTVAAAILTIRAAAIIVAESADLLVLQPDGLLPARPHLHAVPRHALDELVLVVRVRVVLLSAANAGIHACAEVTIVVVVLVVIKVDTSLLVVVPGRVELALFEHRSAADALEVFVRVYRVRHVAH